MNTETIVAPVEATENQSTEPTHETHEAPEVVTPETTEPAPPQTPEKDERDKALARMERRINKKHAEAAAATERSRILEERLRVYEASTERPEPTEPQNIEARARELAQQMTQQERISESIGSVLKAGSKLDGFNDACNAVNEEIPFYARDGKPTDFLSAVLEFDAPEKLLHYLGKDPALVEELADMSPTRRIRRLDAIEREMKESAVPKVSSAPKPLEPVKGSSPGRKDPTEMSQAEFNAWRQKTLKRR